MDVLSVLGLLVACVAIVGGLLIGGGSLESLLNAQALLVVVGGTFAAAMIQSHISVFSHSLKMMFWVFFPPNTSAQQIIKKIVKWSNIARKEGLLGLETIAETEKDVFARKGLQLLVDGNEPEVIKHVLQVEINSKKQFNLQAANVIESMGRYSAIAGLIAAAIGFMPTGDNIDNQAMLGDGVEAAIGALVYGFCLAQFVFVPFARKLQFFVNNEAKIQEMLLEGVLSIADGENPRNIETKLQGFVT